jgi:hypothetical protein
MYKSFVESAVLIGLMLLAIDCDLHRYSQRPFKRQQQRRSLSRKHRKDTGTGLNTYLYV